MVSMEDNRIQKFQSFLVEFILVYYTADRIGRDAYETASVNCASDTNAG